jgi:hypothetical protein
MQSHAIACCERCGREAVEDVVVFCDEYFLEVWHRACWEELEC